MKQESGLVPIITMEDELGIVYLVENAQQFWSGEQFAIHTGQTD
jgi:hypothetical protein